jgi:RNA polymerase sigma factor (sigma-70 family)
MDVISSALLPTWSIMLAPVQEADRERTLEQQLVARAQAGDRKALGDLLTRFGPVLYRSVLLPRLGSEAAARDALSETYEKVVLRIGQFKWQDVGFYPWIRVVALRVALDALRARKRLVLWETEDLEREVDEASTAPAVDQTLSSLRDEQVARAKLRDGLARIHPRYARAIELRVLEERPREEVSKLLGVTPSTFDVLLHRALAALRKTLETPSGDGTGQ